MRRALVIVVLAGLLLFGEQAAHGCSCAYGDPRTRLAEADAAFVGELVTKESPTPGPGGYSTGQQVTYTFNVEQSVKGDLEKSVDVESPAGTSSCGLGAAEGQRIGLLLYREGDVWRSGLCAQMDPDTLIEAASPLPKPTSTGPVAFVVGGRYGDATTIALDRSGRTVAYGYASKWDTTHVGVCPGSRTVVEWGQPGYGNEHVPYLAVRRFDRFGSAKATKLKALPDREPNFNRLAAISCRDEQGSDVLLAVSNYGSGADSDGIAQGTHHPVQGREAYHPVLRTPSHGLVFCSSRGSAHHEGARRAGSIHR